MNAESEKTRTVVVDELSSFERRIGESGEDVAMVEEVRQAIDRMLEANGGNEAQILRVLHERYDSGELSKDTFQLVKSMLDGYASGGAAAAAANSPAPRAPAGGNPEPRPAGEPAPRAQAESEPEPFTSTVVLPSDTAVLTETTADARVQVGSVLRDRFLLQERVTGGGMGVVYKALDRRLAEAGDDNPWVAIKVLSPQFAANGHALRALQQEAAKGRCLVHPNIVRFIDFDRDDDLHFIVMEWLEGRTLADILDSSNGSGVDRQRAFQIVRQVGKALDYAHRCGIVHADVKPGNVMMLPNGDAKLFDFGVARMRQKALEKQPDFDPGVLGLLTPAYSSMQVLGGETPTPADDVFSLACLLYRLLAGYRVFGPRNAAEAAGSGMEPQRLQNVSDAQWRAIKKALSYARVTRFQNMTDFLEALEEDTSEPITITVPARDDLELPQHDRPGGGRRVVAILLVAGLGAVAAWHFDLVDRFPGAETAATVTGRAESRPSADLPIVADPVTETAAPAGAPVDTAAASAAPEEPVGTSQPAAESGDSTAAGSATIREFAGPPAEDVDAGTSAVTGTGAEAGAGIAQPSLAPAVEPPERLAPPLIDFSKLPPPDTEMRIRADGRTVAETSVTLREDGSPVTIDLIRDDVEFALTLRLEEVSFSGNRSPWVNGQYAFADNGIVEFPAGQHRARITLVMTPDPVREADQQSLLRVRDADSSVSEVALINVTLEDDDQRRFEETLPPNTIGFATSQVTVREQDPAVQIDLLRYKPDDTSMTVGFRIRDITATRGEDYFAPANETIEFGPGQRSARLLIPLVQDGAFEDNEAFSVELTDTTVPASNEIFIRTAVMIRDDDN